VKAPSRGSGWHKESLRHRQARLYGKAYATPKSSFRLQYEELEHPKKQPEYTPRPPKERLLGGKADYIPSSDFNQEGLKKGIKVEMEHTNDPKLAEEISKDHIYETRKNNDKPYSSDYYKKLDEMEAELKNKNPKDGGNSDEPTNPIDNNTFELPVQFSITIPSTQDIDENIGTKKMKIRLKEEKKWLVKRFQGDTTYSAKGDYNTKTGKLIEEDVGVINVSTTKKDYEKHKAELAEHIKELRERYGQKQMAYNLENNLYLYPANPKKPYIKHLSKEFQDEK